MHIVIVVTCSLLYSVILQHIPCAELHRLQRIMLQSFQTKSKVHLVVVVHSAMPLELMDSFTFEASAVIALDGLKPYYCNKFSFETFDVISA